MVHLNIPGNSPRAVQNCRVTRQNAVTGPDPSDLIGSDDEIFQMVARSPLDAARTMRQRLGTSRAEHEACLLKACKLAYAAAFVLKKRTINWAAFVKDPFWDEYKGHKPNIMEIRDHLRWMLIFVFDPPDEQAKARVNTYRVALQPFFDNGGELGELASYLKQNGGFDELYEKNRTKKKHRKADGGTEQNKGIAIHGSLEQTTQAQPSRSTLQGDTNSGTADGIGARADSASEDNCDQGQSDRTWAQNLIMHARRVEDAGYRAVIVHMTQDDLDEVVSHPGTDRIGFTCEVTRSDANWANIRCTKVVSLDASNTLAE